MSVCLVCLVGWAKQDFCGLEAVIMYRSNLSFCQNYSPIEEYFWQKDSLLQYTMTLLQGFAHPSQRPLKQMDGIAINGPDIR